MPEGIKIGKIKQALIDNKYRAVEAKEGENAWAVHDSTIDSFGQTFFFFDENTLVAYRKILYGEMFRKFIEQTLSKNMEKHDLTAVEFGGPGSNLFKGFSTNFFKRTIGVCLKDIRTEEQIDYDTKHNHSVIEGNILDVQDKDKLHKNKLLNTVTQILNVKKVDLIISRMEGPLGFIEKNGAILDRIIRDWYDMLNENGLMFIQVDMSVRNNSRVLLKKWSDAIKNKFPNIDLKVRYGVIRLHKKAGDPERLPPATVLFSKTIK